MNMWNAAQRMGKDVKPIDKDAMIEYVRKSGGSSNREEGCYLLRCIEIGMSAVQDLTGIFRDLL